MRAIVAAVFLLLLPAAALAQPAALAPAPASAAPAPPAQARPEASQQTANNAAAMGAAAGAVIVTQADPALIDPYSFPAPTERAREWLGYASPWTLVLLGLSLVLLAGFVGKVAPRKKKRIRRATILFMLYLTTFALAAVLGRVHAEGWSRRVWFLADLFEVLIVIDLVAIMLFDLLLLALRIEIANIVHDLALGAAYILAFIGMLHRSGVHLSATSSAGWRCSSTTPSTSATGSSCRAASRGR
jgi:hypothetical protein